MDLTTIENLNIDRVIRRGTAQIIERAEDVILLKDTESKALMLACDDVAKGIEILERNNGEEKPLIMISNAELGRKAAEKFGYEGVMECYQMAYLLKELPTADDVLEYRIATMENFPLISQEYKLVSEDELKELIERENIIMGYENGEAVGFIGEHMEGSIGLLQVLEKHRRKGYGISLEKEMIRRTIAKGYVPFGQVVVDNTASLELQKKLGLTKSEGTIFWMW
ncbi:GNAT family N-acetyltransferase [Butyrivibrio sp. M55]|uniref:GNAT family N-acetyltransferase n=1 Tax=Butyrivibrio sp. M55 TaxID=1855323 RepID=UPI0008DF6FF5|nr:GNAT family N-acetyltransferase [Butyrivibrio sp. M55]SFU77086.1 Predicted acetyltransferase, GNAT family [Butyrivibrio sp. M55]